MFKFWEYWTHFWLAQDVQVWSLLRICNTGQKQLKQNLFLLFVLQSMLPFKNHCYFVFCPLYIVIIYFLAELLLATLTFYNLNLKTDQHHEIGSCLILVHFFTHRKKKPVCIQKASRSRRNDFNFVFTFHKKHSLCGKIVWFFLITGEELKHAAYCSIQKSPRHFPCMFELASSYAIRSYRS